jgi:hypothetical protein
MSSYSLTIGGRAVMESASRSLKRLRAEGLLATRI